MKNKTIDLLIIGGGISGLTSAFYFLKKKPRALIHVFEKENRFGGLIKTLRYKDQIIDLAMKGFSKKNSSQTFKLIEDLKYTNAILPCERFLSRYVLKNNELLELPLNFSSFLSFNKLSRLILWEFFKNFFLKNSKRSLEDESVSRFILRHFSEDFLYFFIYPFLNGIYGGDPNRLSIKSVFPFLKGIEISYGSLSRGLLLNPFLKRLSLKKKQSPIDKKYAAFELFSFKEGMESIIKKLIYSLGENVCKKNHHVIDIKKEKENFNVKYKVNEQIKSIRTKNILLSSPAYISAEILKNLDSELSDLLKTIHYNSMATVHLSYPKNENVYKGLGFLSAFSQRPPLLGGIWNNQVFNYRSSTDQISLFYGGDLYPLKDWSLKNIEDRAIKDVREILKISSHPLFLKGVYYDKAIPQFHLNHLNKMDRFNFLLKKHKGIYISSNFQSQLGFNQSILDAYEFVEEFN